MANLKLPPTAKGTLWRFDNGHVGFEAVLPNRKWLVSIGPGFTASLASKTSELYEERNIAAARDGTGFVDSRIQVKDKLIHRTVVTKYASKTVRIDTLTISDTGINRKTNWKYANGIEIQATYQPLSRKLVVLKNSKIIAEFETDGRLTRSGFETSTKAIGDFPQAVQITSRNTISSLTTSSPQISAIGSGEAVSNETSVTPRFEGNTTITNSVTTTTPDGSRTTTQSTATIYDENGTEIGKTTTTGITTITPDGDSVSSTINVDEGPSGATITEGSSGTTPDGGIWVNSTVHNPDGSEQSSSVTIDGQGNETEVTRTTDPDGSSNVTTNTRDAATGETQHSSQDYDKDGNPTPSDGNDGGRPAPDDTSSSSSSGYPSPDGTDETPQPWTSAPVGGVLNGWLDTMGSYLGGGKGPNIALLGKDKGDPALFNGVAAAMEDGALGATGNLASNSLSNIDLRPFMSPDQRDPDLNPRAVVGVFAGVSGVGYTSGTLAAVNRLANEWGTG